LVDRVRRTQHESVAAPAPALPGSRYYARSIIETPGMLMRQWRATTRLILTGLCAIALGACSSGPVKRVSEPTVSIQQLEVRADGSWSVELRLQNYSSVPMRFDDVALEIKAGDAETGTLRGSPALTVGPESADVATLAFTPSSAAKIVVADALAERRTLKYSLEGTIAAAAKDRKPRDYKVKRNSALSPVPGRPGVLR
jgi:hypothetical protein